MQNKTPAISVIMGIYNCAHTLQSALDSLYAQTFQDFEIILCDDGSSDNTYEVALKNKNDHGNVVLLRNETNKGLNETLNNCLSVARGKYIARMDGDDICASTRFEKEINFLDSHQEYAIVSTSMTYFDDTGIFGKSAPVEGEPSLKAFVSGTPFCHAPCMVRREAYIDVGGYTVNKWLLRHEDYNLWTKMYAKGYRGYRLPEYLYSMRDDRNASKRRNFKGRINGIYARWIAYKTIHIPLSGFLKFSIVSIIKGILPIQIYEYFHKRKLNNIK